jgi:acetolactate synthase I/II/III large subunit
VGTPSRTMDKSAHRNSTREWLECPADEFGDAIVASLAAGGVECIFFTSGSEIGFLQEAIAKANAQGRVAPRLITVTHEHASLNAALGYTAVSGRIAMTAAHVDVGTQHYGGAVHSAWHSGLPVLITAGAPPTAHPGSMRGARDGGGYIWTQQSFDQHGIVRPYVKWDKRLEAQDNPGLIVSRALQVALTEPRGPVYLSFPREVSLLPLHGARFPSAQQLGVPRPTAPDPDAVGEVVDRLLDAKNPAIVVSHSGCNPRTIPELVHLCECLALPVYASSLRSYHCFPLDHPLYQGVGCLSDADMVLVLEAAVPWMPGPAEPPATAWVAVVDVDPIKARIPTFEFSANLRMNADSLRTIVAIKIEAEKRLTADHHAQIEARRVRLSEASALRRRAVEQDAKARADRNPIDLRWLQYVIGRSIDDNCVVIDDTIGDPPLHDYLHCSRERSYFRNPGSSGGWAPGAAFGAKLAAPDRDVVAVTGDGFYMFGTPAAALWSAAHYGAPFLTIIYQNRSYSTGVTRVANVYPNGYAARSGYDGGYFDPPIDFAKEASAAGGWGENVRDPSEIEPAIQRGLAKVRAGKPSVVAVWLARLLQSD